MTKELNIEFRKIGRVSFCFNAIVIHYLFHYFKLSFNEEKNVIKTYF